jgi:excinuclease ABC subunit B
MKEAIEETQRRREIQEAFNKEHGITPTTISKAIEDILVRQIEEEKEVVETELSVLKNSFNMLIPKERKKLIRALEKEMMDCAERLEFEKAALIRDEITKLKEEHDI